MTQDIHTMPVCQCAVGLLADDRELDIYRVSDVLIWDVTTASAVEPVSWKRASFHTARLLAATVPMAQGY